MDAVGMPCVEVALGGTTEVVVDWIAVIVGAMIVEVVVGRIGVAVGAIVVRVVVGTNGVGLIAA